MPCLHFFLLFSVSSIGTGCGDVGLRGICSPVSLHICNPDKAFGTEEEEVSEFTASLFPVKHAHVDRSDMPPVDTVAPAT